MNQVLDHYADNPIIDELVFWPPKTRRIKSVRAASGMFRLRSFIMYGTTLTVLLTISLCSVMALK